MEDVRMYHHLAIFAFEFRGRSFCKDDTPLLSFYPEDEAGYNISCFEAVDCIAFIGPREDTRAFSASP